MYVDFPDIFGPVRTTNFSFSESKVSFDTKSPLPMSFSTTGCLPSIIFISNSLFISGLTYPFSIAAVAKEIITSR